MFPPKLFDWLEGLDALRIFFQQQNSKLLFFLFWKEKTQQNKNAVVSVIDDTMELQWSDSVGKAYCPCPLNRWTARNSATCGRSQVVPTLNHP